MTTNMPSPSRHPRVLIGVLILVLLTCLGTASASQITLTGARRAYVAGFAPCSTSPVTVTNTTTGTTATQVTISGLDNSNCAGRTIQVWLGSGSSTLAATPGTVGAASATVTVPTYTPASVLRAIVYVGGWPVRTTWQYTPPVQLPVASCLPLSGSGTCSLTETIATSWVAGGATYWQKTFRITTTSPTAVPWQVTINLSDPEFGVLPSALTDLQGGLVLVSTSGCSASPRTVTVKGTTSWGPYNTVTNTRYSEFQVQAATVGTGNLLSC